MGLYSRVAGAIFFMMASLLAAQTPTATLLVRIIDQNGSPVPDAEAEIQNSANNESRKLNTDEKGEFVAPNLTPGVYTVTVSKPGFRTLRQTGLELELDQEARLDLRLQLGPVTDTISVVASTSLLNTENAVQGDVVVTAEIAEMPLNGRDFRDLARLTPGVLTTAQGGAGSAFEMNGARPDNNNFLIDGFNNRDFRSAGAQTRPNIDAMQEFKVETAGYSAESGRYAGGVITAVLKSGGNQLHGSLFEFVRNDIFDARGFFDDSKQALRRNQFGATAGGPIVIPKVYSGRDRTFFLFSWESYRQEQGDTRLGVVPSQSMRSGDFSAFGPLKDPLASGGCTATTRTGCFPNNRIPLSRVSPVSLAVQAYYPLPDRPGVNNYFVSARHPDDWDSVVSRIDEHLTVSDNLSFRYLQRREATTNPFAGASFLGRFGAVLSQPNLLAGLTYTRVFRPTLVNEARVGFSRAGETDHGRNQGMDYNKLFGIAGGPVDLKVIGFPLFNITGYEAIGDPNNEPMRFVNNNYNVSDVVTWVDGRHLVKFGGDLLRPQYNETSFETRGNDTFTGSWTTQPYADFLLGMPNSTTRQIGTTSTYLRSTSWGFFVQDDWKVASNLTLNLGMRYELPNPPHDQNGRWTNFVPELNKLVVSSLDTLNGTGIGFADPTKVKTAQQADFPGSLVYAQHKDLAPRFGFAWRPLGGERAVVRGGYGIFYGSQNYGTILTALGDVFPFVISQTFNANQSKPNYFTIANPFPVQASLTTSSVNVNGFELHAPTPYSQAWNLATEREIGFKSSIEISYAGSKSTHLSRTYNLNQPYRSAATAPNFPIPYPAWGTINYSGFYLNSSYNAGTVTFKRRFADNFFYRVSYTYSKSIDTASQTMGDSAGGYAGFQNARNFNGDRGRSDWDATHNFVTSLSWSAPWNKCFMFRGWQVAATAIARSGTPFTPQVNNVNLALGEANRPDRIGTGTVSNPTADRWYNVQAFPQVLAGAFRFGNSGRNILSGPSMIQFNPSLLRNFRIRENERLQFRWEVFNAFNHSNLNEPVVYVNATNAGTITSAADPRLMQFGLRFTF